MATFSEVTLDNWTNPPSDTEETKLSNAERMVKETINADPILKDKSIEIFGQGSYANNTNVRLNSDIDINVRYIGGFYYDLPKGAKKEDFGLGNPTNYSVQQFKDDVFSALTKKFGYESIVRKNKCITILGNSYRVETDVVPTWNYRRYDKSGDYVLGVKFKADTGAYVVNYPKQHIENGIYKNTQTHRRFKKLTRIFRKLRYNMVDAGLFVNDSITSFLIECLVWNIPDNYFTDIDTWQERLKQSIQFLYNSMNDFDVYNEWGEVSELLYLFRGGRKWSADDVKVFLEDAWNYLGY